MNKRSGPEPNEDLERMLTELFHEPQPDPEFLEGLEKRLLHPAKRQRRWEDSRLGRFFGTLFASAPTLGWGAAAAVLVLALAWILGNLIPRPLTTIQPLLATPSATPGLPTATATPPVTLEKQGTALPIAAITSTPGAPGNPVATPTAGTSPTARPAGLFPGWSFYSNPAYGFSFSYPPGWQVEVSDTHLIQLKQEPLKSLVFNIGFKRSSEDVGIQHAHPITGSRAEAGSLYFLGQEVSRQVVVEGNQEKAVLYNGGAEIRMKNGLLFSLALVDTRTSAPGPSISKDTQALVDRVVASFQLQSGPTAGGQEAYLGRLAFVQGGDLWTLGLPGGTPERLTSGGGVQQPLWSPSGGSIAFRKGEGQVWVVAADGEGTRALNGGGKVGAFAWSPARDQLAYVAGSGELRLADTSGKDLRTLVPKSGSKMIWRLAWSPAGDWLAYQVIQAKAGQANPTVSLWKVPAGGGKAVELYTGNPTLAGWTGDGRALLFWDGGNSFSASLLADGVPLMRLPANGGSPQQLAKSVLLYEDFVRADPSGSARVAVVVGGRREAWTDKQLTLYQDGDRALLSGSDAAASSPAWSQDGRQLAYVLGPEQAQEISGDEVHAALQGRKLWVRDLARNKTTQLTSDPAYRDEYPLWSADGSTLLFARLDSGNAISLWLVPASGGNPQKLVEGLRPSAPVSDPWFGYYGHIDWAGLFDLWRR